MRIAHIAFAITMIGVGIVGIARSDLMPVWNPAPGAGPAHSLLVGFGIGFSLTSGIGLLVHPHSFFGYMTPLEWSTMGYKHLDHHLSQVGV